MGIIVIMTTFGNADANHMNVNAATPFIAPCVMIILLKVVIWPK
jgi:hypothetical protein